MKKFINNSLTPAAQNMLDTITAEYKDQILLRAQRSATKLTGTNEEISVHDILEAIKSSQEKISKSRIDFLIKFYFLFAGVLISIGLSLLIVKFFREDLLLNPEILITFLGGLLAAIAFLINSFYRQTTNTEQPSIFFRNKIVNSDASLNFLHNWLNIEERIRELASIYLGESNSDAPISVILRVFQAKKLLSSNEIVQIKKLLIIRNKILHENYTLKNHEFDKQLYYARNILEKLDVIKLRLTK